MPHPQRRGIEWERRKVSIGRLLAIKSGNKFNILFFVYINPLDYFFQGRLKAQIELHEIRDKNHLRQHIMYTSAGTDRNAVLIYHVRCNFA